MNVDNIVINVGLILAVPAFNPDSTSLGEPVQGTHIPAEPACGTDEVTDDRHRLKSPVHRSIQSSSRLITPFTVCAHWAKTQRTSSLAGRHVAQGRMLQHCWFWSWTSDVNDVPYKQ